jgi:hypothetical protein
MLSTPTAGKENEAAKGLNKKCESLMKLLKMPSLQADKVEMLKESSFHAYQ